MLFRSEKQSARGGYAAICSNSSDVAQVVAIYHSVWHETQAPFMPPEDERFARQRQHSLQIALARLWGSHLGRIAYWGNSTFPLVTGGVDWHRNSSRLLKLRWPSPAPKWPELHCIAGNDGARRLRAYAGQLCAAKYKSRVGQPRLGRRGVLANDQAACDSDLHGAHFRIWQAPIHRSRHSAHVRPAEWEVSALSATLTRRRAVDLCGNRAPTQLAAFGYLPPLSVEKQT